MSIYQIKKLLYRNDRSQKSSKDYLSSYRGSQKRRKKKKTFLDDVYSKIKGGSKLLADYKEKKVKIDKDKLS